jgi:hypothetical protein
VPALVAAVAGVLWSGYFFFSPYYSFYLSRPNEILNLVLFMVVAVVTSHLANSMKRQTEIARKREKETSDLYAFSRRLSAAPSAADIYFAIEEHLANLVQRKVVLFGAGSGGSTNPDQSGLTQRVHCAIADVQAGRTLATTVDDAAGDRRDQRRHQAEMPAREQHRQQIDDRAAAHVERLDQRIGDERGGGDHHQGDGDAAQFASHRFHSNQDASLRRRQRRDRMTSANIVLAPRWVIPVPPLPTAAGSRLLAWARPRMPGTPHKFCVTRGRRHASMRRGEVVTDPPARAPAASAAAMLVYSRLRNMLSGLDTDGAGHTGIERPASVVVRTGRTS